MACWSGRSRVATRWATPGTCDEAPVRRGGRRRRRPDPGARRGLLVGVPGHRAQCARLVHVGAEFVPGLVGSDAVRLAVVLASSSSSSSPTPTHLVAQTMRWRLPVPLAREAVVPQPDGRYVVAGGLVAGDQSTDRVFVLDPASGHSTASPALPVPVHDTAGVLLGGRALVVGGGNASEQDVVQAGDAHGWAVAGHLPQARSDLSAVTVGGRALVLGGYDGGAVAVPEVLASRDGVRWTTIGRLPVPVRYAASVVRGHAVWLFGGERASVMQDVVQRVSASGHAKVVAHLPVALGEAVAVPLAGRILVVGGRLTSSTLTDRMWWFDPRTKTFTPAGRLPVALADSAVATAGPDSTEAYLVGGESPTVTDRVVRLSLR